MEYVNIMEAARRCGVSDKTIRRWIHAEKLRARFPQPNRCEIAVARPGAIFTWTSTWTGRETAGEPGSHIGTAGPGVGTAGAAAPHEIGDIQDTASFLLAYT